MKQNAFRWRWLLSLALVVVLFLIARELHLQGRLKQGLDWVGQIGPWGPLIFIGLYIVATVAVTIFVMRIAKQALAKRMNNSSL